jgi:Protein of unknown function (DUF1194)
MRSFSMTSLICIAATFVAQAGMARAAEQVDLQLILAVDVSRSINLEEQKLQRSGYVAAFRDRALVRAIKSGHLGRIAVTYVEWADVGTQRVLVQWQIVESEATASAFADRLAQGPLRPARRTSISSMFDKARAMFASSGLSSLRRVLDISGDGPNNHGGPVIPARNALIRSGVTINGLPILAGADQLFTAYEPEELERYFRDCVIGGTGAFVLPIRSKEEFASAIRSKLLMEVSGRTPLEPPTVRKAQFMLNGPIFNQGGDCAIGGH